VAQAAFVSGNLYLTLRDKLGTIYRFFPHGTIAFQDVFYMLVHNQPPARWALARLHGASIHGTTTAR
jgi:hypothetical protein